VQFEVVRLLVERYGTRVFAVGDKNQTIYGFRDSDPALFDEVDGLGTYPCVTFSLKRNYRSTPAIVGFCNDVCPEGEAGKMVAAREAGPAMVLPKLAVFEERGDESTYVAAAVMALREAGEDDVAVMARTQKDAYAMAHKLSRSIASPKIWRPETRAPALLRDPGWPVRSLVPSPIPTRDRLTGGRRRERRRMHPARAQ
jgi:superfamily I DNA/RNA helicase